MSNALWLDLGNSRLKYWISDAQQQLIEHGAELHLQSPADLLLGLLAHFQTAQIGNIGVSSVLDAASNQRIAQILKRLDAPVYFAQVAADFGGLSLAYDQPQQLGVDRWLQLLAMTQQPARYCIVGCGTALTIDLLDQHQHLGGYILPNIYLQRDSLLHGTKGIKIAEQHFDCLTAGRNTSDGVHHGILLGLIGAIRYTLDNYSDYQLIFTGGDATILTAHLDQFQPLLIPDLLLNGLRHYVSLQKKLHA
jgi:type III pantothenate kinase